MQLFFIYSDKLVRIWSVETEEEDGGEVIKIQEKSFSPLDAHTYSVNYVEFSPCGSMLASCSLDGTTLVWNTEVTNVFLRITSYF